jgi:hypothetical protein
MQSGNACYHSVLDLLSCSWLSKNIKIQIYRTILLHVVYGCKTSTYCYIWHCCRGSESAEYMSLLKKVMQRYWKNQAVALQGILVIELWKTCSNIAKNSTCTIVGFVGHFQCHDKPRMSNSLWVENLLWINIELLIL